MQPLRLELRAAPVIGRTSFGQEILLGGFSGLRFLGRSPSGLYRFLTHTDRGPNTDEKVTSRGQERPFGLPSFQPQIVFLEADLKLGKLFVSGLLPLFQKDGKPISGRPPPENSEVAVDFQGRRLSPDEHGLDLEGIAMGADGTFWMAEEYGPSLVQFSADGVLLDRLMPGGGLPETLRHRRLNRGFESIALSGKKIFAALESPLDNPPSDGQKNSRRSRITRIVEVDSSRRLASAQYAYLLEEAEHGKLSDLCMDGPDSLLALEAGREWKRIYRVYLAGATNLQRVSSVVSGPGGKLESLTAQELAGHGIVPVGKELVFDLTQMGVTEEKVEGIDRIDEKFIALITDNDFGLAGALDHDNGIALEKESEKLPSLYFLPFPARK